MVERLQRGLAHGAELLLQVCQFLEGERDVRFWTASHIRLLFAIQIINALPTSASVSQLTYIRMRTVDRDRKLALAPHALGSHIITLFRRNGCGGDGHRSSIRRTRIAQQAAV